MRSMSGSSKKMRRQRANGASVVVSGVRWKLDLHEHVAAILRGLEFEADDTQRNQGDRCAVRIAHTMTIGIG